eukprot:2951327-Pleurochrysis_carterae.AAC.1
MLEPARSNLVASRAPPSFWTYAVIHAADVLNRTTGPPPRLSVSSYEALTGRKPRIMPIMPFGCRAYAVKPRVAFSKTRVEPRAWVLTTSGCRTYRVWTSDVYFDESLYPWRPSEEQREDLPVAHHSPDPDVEQPPGLPPAGPPTQRDPVDAKRIGCDTPNLANASRTVLLLFSGPFNRPDGIAT